MRTVKLWQRLWKGGEDFLSLGLNKFFLREEISNSKNGQA
jgi:hypothetical protein